MKVSKKLLQENPEKTVKELFPELFELEIGRWYKAQYGDAIFKITGIDGEKIKAYGFDYKKQWVNEKNNFGNISNAMQPATKQEVEQALFAEAEKIYKKGDYVKSLFSPYEDFINGTFDISFDGQIWANGKDFSIKVFKDGQWAEIIEEPKEKHLTIAEAVEALQDKFPGQNLIISANANS